MRRVQIIRFVDTYRWSERLCLCHDAARLTFERIRNEFSAHQQIKYYTPFNRKGTQISICTQFLSHTLLPVRYAESLAANFAKKRTETRLTE